MDTEERKRCWQLLRQNERGYVRIVCRDGEEIHTALLAAMEEIDGDRYVVCDVLWSNHPERNEGRQKAAFGLNFDEIEEADKLPQDLVAAYLDDQIKLRT